MPAERRRTITARKGFVIPTLAYDWGLLGIPFYGLALMHLPKRMEGMGQVLIVDDDPDIRGSLCEAVDSLGHTVMLAVNGREGIDALERVARPCFVFLDLMMPVLDGWGFLRILEARKDQNDFTVAVMSASYSSETLVKGYRRVLTFLRKPFDVDDIRGLLANH